MLCRLPTDPADRHGGMLEKRFDRWCQWLAAKSQSDRLAQFVMASGLEDSDHAERSLRIAGEVEAPHLHEGTKRLLLPMALVTHTPIRSRRMRVCI